MFLCGFQSRFTLACWARARSDTHNTIPIAMHVFFMFMAFPSRLLQLHHTMSPRSLRCQDQTREKEKCPTLRAEDPQSNNDRNAGHSSVVSVDIVSRRS